MITTTDLALRNEEEWTDSNIQCRGGHATGGGNVMRWHLLARGKKVALAWHFQAGV